MTIAGSGRGEGASAIASKVCGSLVAPAAVLGAALGFGARAVAPLFARPAAWRVLDAGIGITMWWIAFRLAEGSLGGTGALAG